MIKHSFNGDNLMIHVYFKRLTSNGQAGVLGENGPLEFLNGLDFKTTE